MSSFYFVLRDEERPIKCFRSHGLGGWRGQLKLGLVSCAIAITALLSEVAPATVGVYESGSVAQAENDWLQCVKDHQYLFHGSVWSIGSKGQMRASRNNCPTQIQNTGRALADEERAAGRPVNVSKIKALLALSEDRVRAAYTQYLSNQTEQPLRPSLSKGLEAFNLGDYEAAYAHWLPKAKEGNAAAQNNMGILFERGFTSRAPQSDERAAEWFLLASRQGAVEAMRNLARVQARLGNIEASNSWLAQAAASEQQASVQQQQAFGILGYAVGCAAAGGCGSPAVASSLEVGRPPVSVTPQRAVRCRNDPVLKDVWGNPKIKCQ